MNSKGKIIGVNGNMISVEVTGQVSMNEVGYVLVSDKRLKSEVIRIRGNQVEMQVFEMTGGIGIGDEVDLRRPAEPSSRTCGTAWVFSAAGSLFCRPRF